MRVFIALSYVTTIPNSVAGSDCGWTYLNPKQWHGGMYNPDHCCRNRNGRFGVDESHAHFFGGNSIEHSNELRTIMKPLGFNHHTGCNLSSNL